MPKADKSGKEEATDPQSPVRSLHPTATTAVDTPPPTRHHLCPYLPRACLRPFNAPTTFVPFMRVPVLSTRPLASNQQFAAVACMS